MTDLVYLYAAYTIIWAGIFFYILKMHLEQRKLKKEVKMLKEIADGTKIKKNI